MTMGEHKVIVGLGKTGYSCAQYLRRLGVHFTVLDDADNPPFLKALRSEVPEISFGKLSEENLENASQIILSPGVPLRTECIQSAIRKGVKVTGDVAIFSAQTNKPLVAITGSNGKSTVAHLLGEMAAASKIKVNVAGNIGTPCLDVLETDSVFDILEVSSYQLEVVENFKSTAAVVLNLSPDHLDRYASEQDYYLAKSKIYAKCQIAVINRATTFEMPLAEGVKVVDFGLDTPTSEDSFGILMNGDQTYLSCGSQRLLATSELKLVGRHNWLNAMAALALGQQLELPLEKMLAALRSYSGLPHRCEWVCEKNGVTVVNDSKATNPASTVAAVKGLIDQSKDMVLVLGGLSKGADFSELAQLCDSVVSECFVYGQDASKLKNCFHSSVRQFETLDQVIENLSFKTREKATTVLFSPACASQDQFINYEQRGEYFKDLVGRWLK